MMRQCDRGRLWPTSQRLEKESLLKCWASVKRPKRHEKYPYAFDTHGQPYAEYNASFRARLRERYPQEFLLKKPIKSILALMRRDLIKAGEMGSRENTPDESDSQYVNDRDDMIYC